MLRMFPVDNANLSVAQTDWRFLRKLSKYIWLKNNSTVEVEGHKQHSSVSSLQ